MNSFNQLPTGQRIIIVTIDSIIGGGKSTLLTRLGPYLKSQYKCVNQLVAEPSKQWEEDGLLMEMYEAIEKMLKVKSDNKNSEKSTEEIIEEMARAGRGVPALFQVYAFCTRSAAFMKGYRQIRQILLDNPNLKYGLLLLERSILTDREVFASMLARAQLISPSQLRFYQGCFDAFSVIIEECKPDLCVWLDTHPTEGMRRIKIRDRPGEKVSPDYEESLYQEHQRLFGADTFCGIPVLKVDGNGSFHECDQQLDVIASAIYKRVQSIINESN